jgi:serine/threonine protein kinase
MPTCSHCGAETDPGLAHCPECGVTQDSAAPPTWPGPGHDGELAPSDALIGRSVIGQFVIRRKLSEGAMGAVYVADQPAIGRTVVIKVVHAWLSRDPKIAARFGDEARAAARLQNPHIVSIYNSGRLPDDTLFIAMEHLRGSTLAELLRRQSRLEPRRAVAIARQVCEALSEAHRHGIVHRDLKPANIMICARGPGPGFVKVLDFGVAKFEGRDFGGEGTVGTPAYMSPEQARGEPVDARSDVYTLGVILYEMLAGRLPIPFEAGRPVLDRPRAPRPFGPDVHVPHGLAACVMRALAHDPAQRTPSAERLADELYETSRATIEGATIPITLTPEPRPRVAVAAITGALLLASGAVFGTWAWRSMQDDDPTHDAATTTSEAPSPAAARAPSDVEAHRALLALTPEALATELQRIALLRGIEPGRVELALARGLDASALEHRERLATTVLAWARGPVRERSVPASIDELEAVFLTMDSPLDLQARRRMLNELKDTAAGRETLRAYLFAWIRDFGGTWALPVTGGEEVDIKIED